jgi:hypothetical protein
MAQLLTQRKNCAVIRQTTTHQLVAAFLGEAMPKAMGAIAESEQTLREFGEFHRKPVPSEQGGMAHQVSPPMNDPLRCL